MARNRVAIDGWLNVFKPRGMTSFAVVKRVQTMVGVARVGHAGTLDPDAEGVLPMALGSATRLLEWCQDIPKVYRGSMVVGTLTETGDGSGTVRGQSGPPLPQASDLAWAAQYLEGDVTQIPPQVSALKADGVRMYQRVREGQSVWPKPRRVMVYRLRVTGQAGRRFQIEAEVGKGTYIRALVRDWGLMMGHSAHLEDLERIRVGAYDAEHALTLDVLAESWQRALQPTGFGLSIPLVPLSAEHRLAVLHGRPIEDWEELGGCHGDIGLTVGDTVAAVVSGPPWRYRKVLINAGGDGRYAAT